MSKTKKLKQKTTGFDIVYRVVTAIMAILMYPLFWFLDLIYIEIEHSSIADILGMLNQNAKPNLEYTYDRFSIPEIIDLANVFSAARPDDAEPIAIDPSVYPALVAAGFLAVALLLGVVIFFFAVFSNKVKPVIGLSAAGFLCTVIAFFCFQEGFVAPILEGEVTIAQLFGQESNMILQLIFGLVGSLSSFVLEDAFFCVMFLLLGIVVWSASIYVVNRSEEKEKAMKAAARNNR